MKVEALQVAGHVQRLAWAGTYLVSFEVEKGEMPSTLAGW